MGSAGARLSPVAFDQLVTRDDQKIWGASAIARLLGVSVDTVYTLAADPDSPIYRPGGRYFALRSELLAWLRTK